jgi:hypothetical protein
LMHRGSSSAVLVSPQQTTFHLAGTPRTGHGIVRAELSMVCLVCKHAFSWRIAPLERVCSQCGSLHVLKSGVWELKSRGTQAEAPVVMARRQHTARVALMKVLPGPGSAGERRVR